MTGKDKKAGGKGGGKSRTPTGDEQMLWADVTADVRPFLQDRIRVAPKPLPRARKKAEMLPPLPEPESTRTRATDLDGRTQERLRKGKMPIDRRIDLHGHTRDEAQDMLCREVLRAYDKGLRCLLVITGKSGEGVLKRHLPQWLDSIPLAGIVLRHSPAIPEHGGEGAFYVLLRRKR